MLLEIAKGCGVRRFVFASSCSVYGATDEFVDEHSQTRPVSLYAETKVDSEKALLEARSEHLHSTILRFATVFGHSPRPRFDLVVNLLVAKAHKEGRITIFNGRQWRPFIHVEDVARGIIAALDAPLEAISGQIFNVGDSRLNYTLTEIGETIRAFFPDARIESSDTNDRRNYRVSFEKIRGKLGFECTMTLEDGVREMKVALERKNGLDHASPLYHNQRYLQELGVIQKGALDARVMAAFAQALDPMPIQTQSVPAPTGKDS
jgi:nucleoside-diphosphate-sugar epimerase